MIYVFGGVNIDLLIRIKDGVRMYESNPASISVIDGGVGRNIARAIGNYKPCELVSAFPNELYNKMVEDLNKHNVSTKYSKFLSNQNSSMYVDIIDDSGVVLGASDMSVIEEINELDVVEAVSLTNNEDIIVVDTNLNYKTIEYIVKNSKGYKILDAVSSKKLEKIVNLISLFDLAKVNNLEYKYIKDNPSKKVLRTTGNGLEIIENGKRTLILTHKTLKPVNPNGCGDTLLGTYIANIDKGDTIALRLAIIASAAASQINDAVPTLDEINNINESELEIK